MIFLLVMCSQAWILSSDAGRHFSQHLTRPWPVRQLAECPTMMATVKKDVLELEGVVLEALPSATFRVQLDGTQQVPGAHTALALQAPAEITTATHRSRRHLLMQNHSLHTADPPKATSQSDGSC